MGYPYQDQFQADLQGLHTAGTFKIIEPLDSKQGPEITVGGRTVLNFCANNYLGLAGNPDLIAEAHKTLDEYGYGTASVPFICGTTELHKRLERAVAKFLGMDDAILYSSCFDANTGLFETLLVEGDAVFSDELNHASIIDGIRLCKAERFRFKHADMTDLEQQLASAKTARRKLIVTDGVFSMDGDTAKVSEICDLAQKYEALVVVDDSHASGVLGATGRGSIEATNSMGRVDLVTSTFGKALGGASGGVTAGRREIIDYLRQRSRPSLFSNALAPVITGVTLHVIEHFDDKFQPLLKKAIDNTTYFRNRLQQMGFTLGGDGRHPITPVMLFDEHKAATMADELFKLGIYVRGFTYPVVPKGKARIRVQLSAAHTREQMDKALAAFEQVGKVLNIIS
jgi:glycine C-acetyltransferase